ncbi:MAG: hypothetical protein WCI64_05885 [Chlorobium sp.]
MVKNVKSIVTKMCSLNEIQNNIYIQQYSSHYISSGYWKECLKLPLNESISMKSNPIDYQNVLYGILSKIYDCVHPINNKQSKLHCRLLPSTVPVCFEVFLSGMQRQYYEECNRQYKSTNQSWNRLAFSQNSLVYRSQMALAPDGFPFFPYHFLLRPVDPAKLDEEFIDFGLDDFKFGMTTSNHLDLRRQFKYDDVVNMAKFVKTLPSFMINQSMDGSGASIEENIHAHAFRANETKFPLFNPGCTSPVSDCSVLWAIDKITFGIVVSGTPEDIAQVFIDLRNEFHFPSNHYIQTRDDFGGLTGLYIPRTKIMPDGLKFVDADWKFGAFEVLGLFDAKNMELYESLTSNEAEEAIRSVTIQDDKLRNAFKARARATMLGRGY